MKINSGTGTRRFLWLLAILLGMLQAWSARMTMVNDTVSYLDMGDYICGGQWSMAVNGLWNPLYAALLGLTESLFRPSPYWEYPLVHLLLFLIFLFALGAFDFFLLELIDLRQEGESSEELSPPIWVWLTIGYTLFMWSSLVLISVSETNPDMMVAAFFYLACGYLVRIRRGNARWTTYLGLGLALGLAYLTKSVMFPISFICLGVAGFASRSARQGLVRVFASLFVFLAVTGPFITALSIQKGRFTFGDSGKYNYAHHINSVPSVHWQGENPANGVPVHATRKIFDRPATFEFAGPLGGTYPVWYDPSFWYEGVRARFNMRQQIKALARNLGWEIFLVFALAGSLISGLFVLFYVSGRKSDILKDVQQFWFLLVPAVSALGLYSLVHYETRYVASFVVVVYLCLFFSIHLQGSPQSQRLVSAVAILLFLMFMAPFGPGRIPKHFVDALDLFRLSRFEQGSDQEVVKELYRMGLQPGDHIASLTFSNLGTVM